MSRAHLAAVDRLNLATHRIATFRRRLTFLFSARVFSGTTIVLLVRTGTDVCSILKQPFSCQIHSIHAPVSRCSRVVIEQLALSAIK